MTDTDMLYVASLQKRNEELEARVAELEAKHHNECSQIARYDDELSAAKRLLKLAVEDMEQANQKGRCSTCFNNLHNAKGLIGKCQACHYFSLWKWRNEAEALALIGEDIDAPATEGDTNVGRKQED